MSEEKIDYQKHIEDLRNSLADRVLQIGNAHAADGTSKWGFQIAIAISHIDETISLLKLIKYDLNRHFINRSMGQEIYPELKATNE